MPTVEFQEFVHATGDTTKRAMYRVRADNGPWMFSVVVGVSRTAQTELAADQGWTDEQFDRAHIQFGERAIRARIKAEPSWAIDSQGDTEVVMDLTSSVIDKDEFRRLAAG